MTKRRLVFGAKDVMGYSPIWAEGAFVSRLLIDEASVGSTALVVNHFTLKAGKRTELGSHPPPFDEFYYVLRGSGRVYLNDSPDLPIGPDSVVFIPSDTLHSVEADIANDLEMVTVMPHQPVPGANPVYDSRIRDWGTSFRFAKDDDANQNRPNGPAPEH